MSFTGFAPTDFATFTIDGLENRMIAIKERIQPKFKALGDILCNETAMLAGNEMYLHIARHARRKVNAPKDTWLAISNNKRGYKQHPHFQVGLFDDHVFVWFALIYELPHKKAIAESYLRQLTKIKKLIPKDYVISFDHMQKESVTSGKLSEKEWKHGLERFRDIQKVELLIGRHFLADDPILQDGEAFSQEAKSIVESLIPLYKMACAAS
ncbi:DUF1054 domain-containing protein [Paenibacillus psychroresistens]|uniref:UPF0637 protein EHS13_19915 n=1 Tax=Paenibacillus psychroresistens TaxID=1778678 RepID=A0A6B8RKQ9_9BACL|nr:DUF1054 domain-containing protein [Paenibacillus psychroresistens]QGQ96991.1 DUF1054 domain-containing protein [Paenibacillus psychroresistens]